MPYSRPTLAALVSRIQADMATRLAQDEPLRRSDADVYGKVFAGAISGAYGYLDWVADQALYDTADEVNLRRWAGIFGVDASAATKAVGALVFALQSSSADLPIGTLVQALDGVQYITTSSPIVSGSAATADAQAVVAGASGNRPAGDAVTLVQPVAGVAGVATAGEFSGGAEADDVDKLRAKLYVRLRTPPQGGSKADYLAWALSVPGVTRAWVAPLEMGAGTVTVRFVCDGNGQGAAAIPDAGMVAAVDDVVQARKPVTATVYTVAPIAYPVDMTIRLSPDATATRAAVVAELQDLLTREAQPGGLVYWSHLGAAISAAAGEEDHELIEPSADVYCPPGRLAVLGDITWA